MNQRNVKYAFKLIGFEVQLSFHSMVHLLTASQLLATSPCHRGTTHKQGCHSGTHSHSSCPSRICHPNGHVKPISISHIGYSDTQHILTIKVHNHHINNINPSTRSSPRTVLVVKSTMVSFNSSYPDQLLRPYSYRHCQHHSHKVQHFFGLDIKLIPC